MEKTPDYVEGRTRDPREKASDPADLERREEKGPVPHGEAKETVGSDEKARLAR